MRFPARALVLILLAPLLASACRSTQDGGADEGYVMAFLVRGPSTVERTSAERQEIQRAHMGNIVRLANERRIVVAGPFGKPVPDDRLRGIFVFATEDLERAREWTNSDPAVQAGTLGMELAGFRTDARLRDALEEDLAADAERAKAGQEADPAGRIRGYVMLLARDASKARAALADLRERGKVLIEGELARSTRATFVAVLDAGEVEEAESLLGERRAEIGDHDLASWWASRSLAGLAAR